MDANRKIDMFKRSLRSMIETHYDIKDQAIEKGMDQLAVNQDIRIDLLNEILDNANSRLTRCDEPSTDLTNITTFRGQPFDKVFTVCDILDLMISLMDKYGPSRAWNNLYEYMTEVLAGRKKAR